MADPYGVICVILGICFLIIKLFRVNFDLFTFLKNNIKTFISLKVKKNKNLQPMIFAYF